MEYEIKKLPVRSIKELPPEEKPREKIRLYGVDRLSDSELICAILGSGCAGIPVQELAAQIIDLIAKTDTRDLRFDDIAKIKGMGMAQSSVICAALELGRRLQQPVKPRFSTTQNVFEHIRHYGDRPQEHLLCIMFNGALEILGTKVITVGLVNRTLIHPREVFSEALKARATAIVIAHNHPSGNLQPSSDDLAVTQVIINAGKVLGIQVLDHLIFSEKGFYSINEHGDIWFN